MKERNRIITAVLIIANIVLILLLLSATTTTPLTPLVIQNASENSYRRGWVDGAYYYNMSSSNVSCLPNTRDLSVRFVNNSEINLIEVNQRFGGACPDQYNPGSTTFRISRILGNLPENVEVNFSW